MSRERDDENGKFTESYPPAVFVETPRNVGPTGTRNVADGLAYRRLRELEQGRASSSRVGNVRLWSAAEGDA